jgi:hypothetical protein
VRPWIAEAVVLQPVEMAATKPATLSGAGLRRVLVVLCVTEITSWGVLYYAFPVLAPSIAADTGWSSARSRLRSPRAWSSPRLSGSRPGGGSTAGDRGRRWPVSSADIPRCSACSPSSLSSRRSSRPGAFRITVIGTSAPARHVVPAGSGAPSIDSIASQAKVASQCVE